MVVLIFSLLLSLPVFSFVLECFLFSKVPSDTSKEMWVKTFASMPEGEYDSVLKAEKGRED